MEHNTKPILFKRFIADGFDIVSLFLVFILLNILLSATPLFNNYYKHVENYKAIETETLNEYGTDKLEEMLSEDETYQNERFAAILHSCLIRMGIGFLGELILFLIIPLINKDGLTIGKQLCGVMLFDEYRQNKINKKQVIARFVFIVLSSVFIYPWTGIYSFLLYPVLRFIILMLNKKNKTLTDYLSRTMYIEKLSYSSI